MTRIGPIGPDIDLDNEDIRLPDGTRLTEAEAERLAERVLKQRRAGRPSLTGSRRSTPSLTVRVPSATREALEDIARTQDRHHAAVSRDALTEYVDRHRS